jgi:hypothetical protein
MDANFLNFLISLAAGVGTNLTSVAASHLLKRVIDRRPDLEQGLIHPASSAEFERALGEAAGVLEALAGSGSISIDGSLVTALRSARFDHQHGKIRIGDSLISAPMLETGGSGSGSTEIAGNTELRSAGTSIRVGSGASIKITGNAGIKQT